MKKENIELLESLINDRLNKAMQEGNSNAFDEAMKAIDRQLEIDKKEFELAKEEIKQQFEKEKEESRQQFELDKEDGRQQFEMNKEDKRQEFELERDTRKADHELLRDDQNREHELKRDKLRNQFELEKDELAQEFEMKKIEAEAKKAKKETIIKMVELGATVIAAPLIETGCKKAFAYMLCEFEKDYSFTTMAGKSLSGLFKFRK